MEMFDRAGDDYDFAVVLDADSLMSGGAIRRLIRLMEENPRLGIVQTVSYATGRETLFARIQQFAVRLYAPLALRGLDFWQGAESSYWGHNAILRVAPFRAHCRLPVLPGGRPSAGRSCATTSSRRRCWRAPAGRRACCPSSTAPGRRCPPTRSTCWAASAGGARATCSTHRILGLPGLKPASRGHILLGIGGYLTAPLWWVFLLGGAARVLLGPWLGADPEGRGGLGLLAYGATERGPRRGLAARLGGRADPRAARAQPPARLRRCAPAGRVRRHGRLAAGAALEQGIWLLLGPVLSLVNSGFVLWTVMGRVVPWVAQSRADRHVTLAEAWRCHSTQVAVGVRPGGRGRLRRRLVRAVARAELPRPDRQPRAHLGAEPRRPRPPVAPARPLRDGGRHRPGRRDPGAPLGRRGGVMRGRPRGLRRAAWAGAASLSAPSFSAASAWRRRPSNAGPARARRPRGAERAARRRRAGGRGGALSGPPASSSRRARARRGACAAARGARCRRGAAARRWSRRRRCRGAAAPSAASPSRRRREATGAHRGVHRGGQRVAAGRGRQEGGLRRAVGMRHPQAAQGRDHRRERPLAAQPHPHGHGQGARAGRPFEQRQRDAPGRGIAKRRRRTGVPPSPVA